MPEALRSQFVNRLVAADRDAAGAPGFVAADAGPAPAARFAVHVRNRRHALIDALAANFPVVAALVGERFFQALASAFIGRHPPRSPALFDYGEAFPAFIEGFAAAGEVACLADVARLERAWTLAYHAAEAAPLGLAALAGCDPVALAGASLSLHPSLQCVASPHPIVEVWQAHRRSRTGRPLAVRSGQCALVVRPDACVAVTALECDELAFIQALDAGASIEAAAADGDAAGWLRRLFDCGGVVAVHDHRRNPA